MCFFGGDHWKPLFKFKSHLVAKYTSGPGSCPIAFIITGFNNMLKKLKILLHGLQVKPLTFKADKTGDVFNNN